MNSHLPHPFSSRSRPAGCPCHLLSVYALRRLGQIAGKECAPLYHGYPATRSLHWAIWSLRTMERLVTIAAGDPPANLTAAQVFDAHGDWIIPGFISAHSHLWQAAYHGIAADDTLTSWIDDLYLKRAIKASPEDLYWFCLLGSLDHLQRGVTTAYDFNYSRTDWTGQRQRVR